MRLILAQGTDKRRYNIPTSSEVAVIISDKYGAASHRDILLRHRNAGDNQFEIIEPNHGVYTPFHYVLLFLYGADGCHWRLR